MAVARCKIEIIWDNIHLCIVMCGDKGRLLLIYLYNYLIFRHLGSILFLILKKMTVFYFFSILTYVEKSVDKYSDLLMIYRHIIKKPF